MQRYVVGAGDGITDVKGQGDGVDARVDGDVARDVKAQQGPFVLRLMTTLTTTELLLGPAERYDLIVTLPIGYNGAATVDYHDIRLKGILSTVTTTVTGIDDQLFIDGFET